MNTSLVLLGDMFLVLGDIIIALVVMSVHGHVLKEKRIDAQVLSTIKRERIFVVIGIGLIIAGFILRLVAMQ